MPVDECEKKRKENGSEPWRPDELLKEINFDALDPCTVSTIFGGSIVDETSGGTLQL